MTPAIYIVPIVIGVIVVAAAVACIIMRKGLRRQSKPRRPDRYSLTSHSALNNVPN